MKELKQEFGFSFLDLDMNKDWQTEAEIQIKSGFIMKMINDFESSFKEEVAEERDQIKIWLEDIKSGIQDKDDQDAMILDKLDDDSEEFKNCFYDGMFLQVYSLYESTMVKLYINYYTGIGQSLPTPQNNLYASKVIDNLSKLGKKVSYDDNKFNEYSNVRNYIIHNNGIVTNDPNNEYYDVVHNIEYQNKAYVEEALNNVCKILSETAQAYFELKK